MSDDPRLAAADFLFALLDDIDTASDIARADDKAYRAMVERIQRRRFEVADTNGYTVSFKVRTAVVHASDCATHDEPAMPAGPCDCGAAPAAGAA